jgi:hypothetical protein
MRVTAAASGALAIVAAVRARRSALSDLRQDRPGAVHRITAADLTHSGR